MHISEWNLTLLSDMFKKYLYILCALIAASCSDIESPEPVAVAIEVRMPADLAGLQLDNPTITFNNLSNSGVTSFVYTPGMQCSVLPGLYDVQFDAESTTAAGVKAHVGAIAPACKLLSAGSINLDAYVAIQSNDLIIKEIFYTGTLQSSGNSYNGDQYIKLYNNTDHTIYADGLALFESLFLTTQKFNYTPDKLSTHVSIDAIYLIPGSGKDYPVEPGQTILIADAAIDHRAINPNSFNLSGADFEWFDDSTDPKYTDLDNPAVPNLDKWYCYTNTIFLLHNRGFKAYGLARIPQDRDTFLKEHFYTVDYDQVTVAGSFPMSKNGYLLPNEWIVDIVNLSVEAVYQWNVCLPAMDAGWSYCGTIDNDKTRFFHSVRRRVDAVEADGIEHLRDTNNSTLDFIPEAIPSEIEEQGTAIDYEGNLYRP